MLARSHPEDPRPPRRVTLRRTPEVHTTPRRGLLAAICALALAVALAFAVAPAQALAADAGFQVITGAHRYHTAQLLSQAMFPGPLPEGSGVVVAPGETFPEALCGAPLAAAYGGPVLLTPGTGLENGTSAELQRLAPDYVFCIGLAVEVVAAVDAALPEAAVTAINGAGGSVYDMSRQVANALEARVGDLSGATAIITIGYTFPDALGAAPLACAMLWPILLTDKADGSPLHADAAATLADLGITSAIKLGTYATLPPEVSGVANLSGADRYATNANVAEWARTNSGLSFTHLGVCTGEKFPDALAAGPYLALDDGILLLTKSSGVPPATATTLKAHAAEAQRVDYIGLAGSTVLQFWPYLPIGLPPSTPTLGWPSSGSAVAWLEAKLSSLTYRPGPVDGVYDQKTYNAVIAFQKWQGLTRDGRVTADDWAALVTAKVGRAPGGGGGGGGAGGRGRPPPRPTGGGGGGPDQKK
jgi:putative cell wall-binding protein